MEYTVCEYTWDNITYVTTKGKINNVTRYKHTFRKHDNVLIIEYNRDENEKFHGTYIIRHTDNNIKKDLQQLYNLPIIPNADVIETIEYNHGIRITSNIVNTN